jgi:hypothetical protein
MILYDYDSNAILAQPIKDRKAPEFLKAFQVMEQELVARGLIPKLMKLDNEASKLQKITFINRILLNYFLTLVARPHERTGKSKRPESHPTKECAPARVRCIKTEPN